MILWCIQEVKYPFPWISVSSQKFSYVLQFFSESCILYLNLFHQVIANAMHCVAHKLRKTSSSFVCWSWEKLRCLLWWQERRMVSWDLCSEVCTKASCPHAHRTTPGSADVLFFLLYCFVQVCSGMYINLLCYARQMLPNLAQPWVKFAMPAGFWCQWLN